MSAPSEKHRECLADICELDGVLFQGAGLTGRALKILAKHFPDEPPKDDATVAEYRTLVTGEYVEYGDEVFHREKWMDAGTLIGHRVDPTDENDFRRPLTKSTPPPRESGDGGASVGEAFFQMLKMSEALVQADNLKLVWLLNQAFRPFLNNLSVMGPEHEIWHHMEDRLAPEYDGENYRMTDTGWITPKGEIKYV